MATVLEPQRLGKDLTKTVQLVFDSEGAVDRVAGHAVALSNLGDGSESLGIASLPASRQAPGTVRPHRVHAGQPPPGMAVILVPIDQLLGAQAPLDLSQVGNFGAQVNPRGGPDLPGRQVLSQSPAGRHSLPRGCGPAAPAPEGEADLMGLKQEVARLPRHHPLRLALQGEPNRMPRAELIVKMREWAKYLGWKDSP